MSKTYRSFIVCRTCNGNAYVKDAYGFMLECSVCDGTGQVEADITDEVMENKMDIERQDEN